jgi:hypothetical protein
VIAKSKLLAGVLSLVATTVTAADFYVSPCGNDTNSGSLTRPFQTIQKAANVMAAGDTCLIRSGTYREAVIFPRSGTAGKPITIKPYRRERVTVSGCEPVTGWIRHSNHIWKAAMPWTLGLGRNQVFSGGQIMLEARYPNAPAPGLELPVSGLTPLWPTYGEFTIPKETRVSQPGRIVSALLAKQPADYWKGALYCGVHFEGWCAQTGVIESSKPGEIQVGDRTQGWWFGSAYDGKFPQEHEEGRGMIVGHLHALDAPGEWHWQDNTLYLIATGAAEPQAVEAKRRQIAFDLSGREHIRIEGLAVQAASMRLENSAHCVVDGCDLAYIAHYTRQYGIGQIEHGRDTIKSGETGIYVSGYDNAFLNCGVRFSAGTGFHIRGHHHTIHNCLIDEVSYVGHYLNAITDAVSDFGDYENLLIGGHVITFNTMRNAGRHFFNFNGNGTSLASRNRGPMDYAATLFAHNHLYNGMLLTRDAGFLTGYFCSGGTLNGLPSQVAFNVMHDCYDLSAMRWNKLGMVYLDEGTCNVDVHNNLFWAAPGSLQRDLWFNTCCVGVSEFSNIFHGLFTRRSSELRAEDFPHGEPFRFGHDFAAPPALPQWPWPPADALRLDLGTCSLHAERATNTLAGVAGLANGDWLAFDGVNFADGWRSAIIRFASDAKAMNTGRSARTAPRHRKPTDPLVFEAKTNDGASEKMRMQWTFFYNVDDSAWVRYEGVPLGDGYRRIRAVYGNDRAEPWRMEVRLDRVDGPLVGSVELTQTDRERGSHVQIYREAEAELSPEATGTRDVYLVFRSKGGKPAVDFEYARFEQYRGDLPLQKNEVKLELRAGGKDGRKLGEFYPRFTGGAESASEFVASLEDHPFVSGPLVLLVRSALSEPIGTLSGVRLERSGNGRQWPGIGVPPRRRWWGLGGMILPEATHRPLPAPADRYGDSGGARPFHRATRLAARPVIDGLLTEWTGRALELKQAREGVIVEEAIPHAWAGYDEEAFYVALRAPLRNPDALVTAGYQWGDTDGVELAFQNAESTPTGQIMTLRGWPDGRFCTPDVAGISDVARRRLDKAVTYRSAVGKDAWTCEWRIPFGVCGSPRALLKANLTVRNAGQDLWRTWNMASGATFDLRNGGTFILGANDNMLSDRLKQGLEVWLDASDASQIEKDAGGAVRVWKDRSGKGRHAVQANPEFRPHFVAHGLNGKAALKFDDKRRTRLEAPDLSDRPMTATVFAVISNPEPGLPQNSNSRVFTASDGKAYDYLCGISCNLPGAQTGGPRLLTFEGKDRWARRVRVGCFSPNDQTFLNGYVSEILVFGRALTTDERYRVTAYLTGKWDL